MGTGGLVVQKRPLLEWEEKTDGRHVLQGGRVEVRMYYQEGIALPAWYVTVGPPDLPALRATLSFTAEEYGKAREAAEALLGIAVGYT